MNKKFIFLLLICFFAFSTMTYAHSGRTDSSGGHNCSQKSINKGLCTGYHYHNGGSPSSGSSSSSTESTTVSNDKNCSDFSSYDEVVAYWNAKGYSATYDPENLDGWGNTVDDGIPCEAPGGYDLTKVNNSTYQQEAKEEELGTKDGYDKGYAAGYQNASQNTEAGGSDAYKIAYVTSYTSGYLAGQAALNEEIETEFNNGEILGKSGAELMVPENIKARSELVSSYEEGYEEGKKFYIEEQKKHYYALGSKDGENDTYNNPETAQQEFLVAYEDGYKEGQATLKEQYVGKGYEAAFNEIKYKAPDFESERLIKWYKEGFESNEVVKEIQDEAFQLGKNGEDLVIPEKYNKAKELYTYYYNQGKEEYTNPLPYILTGSAVVAGGAGGFVFIRKRRKTIA